MKVKICGITNYNDAKLSVDLGADMIGFVFYKRSRRFLLPEAAREINNKFAADLIKVGVFVDESVDYINECIPAAGINTVQLIGTYSPESMNQINAGIIKVFRVDSGFNYNELNGYSGFRILLDTYDQNEQGGTGKEFDRAKIPDVWKRSVIIAGGVSVLNVESIFTDISPYGVDLSSSVESQPGKKDSHKLKEFFEIVNKLRNQ